MFWLLPLAGAAIGAMSNKQNRLKGALTGAALGAGGGMAAGAMGAGAAGGLLGGAGGAGAAGGSAGLLGASAASGGASPLAAYMTTGAVEGSTIGGALAGGGGAGAVGSGSTAGLLGMGQQAMGYAKPIMQAGQAAQQVQGMFGSGQQPIQASPMQQAMPGTNQILMQLAQQGMQEQQMTDQASAERRKRRQGLLGASYG